MFYGMEFPSSIYAYSWGYPMCHRFSSMFSFLSGITAYEMEDAYYGVDGYSENWESILHDIYPEEKLLGPDSWSPSRPGGPGYGSELGVPASFGGNLNFMGHGEF